MTDRKVMHGDVQLKEKRRPSPAAGIAAVIFDVDGVLADTARLHADAWRRLAIEIGVPAPVNLADAVRGLSREDSLRVLLNGRDVPAGQFRNWMQRKNDWFVGSLDSLSPRDALPGAVELLEGLQAAGIMLAAASASRNARTVLHRISVAKYFSAIVDGNDEAKTKSGLHRFLIAAAALHVDPRRCMVVEDSAAGITAARAAGMKSIGVGSHAALCAADLSFWSLTEVRASDLLRDASAVR